MRIVLALLAITVSVALLGWVGLRDPKRMRAQHGKAAPPKPPLTTPQRKLLAVAAAVPGLLLMLSGWWSSAILWIGATVTLVWLWVLWLSRPRARFAAAEPNDAEPDDAERDEAAEAKT